MSDPRDEYEDVFGAQKKPAAAAAPQAAAGYGDVFDTPMEALPDDEALGREMASQPSGPDWNMFGKDSPGLSDFGAGVGNTFNLDRLVLRALLSGQSERDALEALDRNEQQRRLRGNSFGAGKFTGEVAAGTVGGGLALKGVAAAAPTVGAVTRGAVAGAGTGAATEGASAYGKTGSAEDAFLRGLGGAAVGGGFGAAVPAAGWLGRHVLGGKGVQAAERSAGEMGIIAGKPVPIPSAPTKTYVKLLEDLGRENPALVERFLGGGGEGAVKAAAKNMSPAEMTKWAQVIGAEKVVDGGVRRRAGAAMMGWLERFGKRATQGVRVDPSSVLRRPVPTGGPGAWPRLVIPRSQDLAPALPGAAARAVLPDAPAPPRQEQGNPFELDENSMLPAAGPSSYNQMLDDDAPAPSPVDDMDGSAMYGAMQEAVQSDAVRARPGMHREVSGIMTDWARGKPPDQDQLALLNYKMGEIPGLQWAAINPDRRET